MTTTQVRDKKIALTQRRITDAQKSRTQHTNHITRIDRELAALQRELEWLQAMPVDDKPSGNPTTNEATTGPVTGD